MTVAAKILEIRPYWTNRKHYAPYIVFRTTENRQIYFTGKGARSSPYRAGQFVEVVYDPANPHNAEIRYDASEAEMSSLRHVVGVVSLVVALLAFLFDIFLVFLMFLALIGRLPA